MATIIIEREKQAAIDSIRSSEAALRECMDKLHGIPELELPANLGNIAEVGWVREQLNGCIALVKSDKSLTADERESRLAPWRAIKAKAERAVNKIAFIINDLQPLEWFPDEDGKNYHLDPNQVEQVAEQKATKPVPTLAEEHWRLIIAMRSAVKQLRDFEQENKVKDIPLSFFARMDEQRIFSEWVSGNILLTNRVIGGKTIAPQKTKQIYY